MAIHTLDERGLPPADLEFRLASHLLGARAGLMRAIMNSLVGRPRRFVELRGLLGGRSGNNLTSALRRLAEEDVLDQRLDASVRPAAVVYELSDLGIDVVRMMERRRAAQAMAKDASAALKAAAHA